MLATLPELLAGAPAHERALLELRAEWPSLPETHERVAARLRVFVLNWDPLEPSEPRATATGDGDSFELVLYVPFAAARDDERLGDLCRAVLEAGVSHERLLRSGAYARLAHAGQVPGLLSRTGTPSGLGPPALAPAGDGWEPIGLGAIQDLVQAEFGPVHLERSRVALGEAAAALGEPTYGLPVALLSRLEQAIHRIPGETASDELLRGDAAAALELAAGLRGRPEDFEEWLDTWMAHDWMSELPWELAQRGLADDAVRVADAFAELDPLQRSAYAGDAALILAEAGRADEARARTEANLRTFPRDVWARVHAGDMHRELGDDEQAEREYRRAAALAEGAGHAQDVAAVAERLAELLLAVPGRERDAAAAVRAARRGLTAGFGQRIAATTGRNDPCPCGSGRKFKKCCGA
jgi:tetratricopeptide (TPR) repeat protein